MGIWKQFVESLEWNRPPPEPPWWMLFPGPSRAKQKDGNEPDPVFAVGDQVRLRGKPEKVRRIVKVEWHWHRQCYCYEVETETWKRRKSCPAYWFEVQLKLVERGEQSERRSR